MKRNLTIGLLLSTMALSSAPAFANRPAVPPHGVNGPSRTQDQAQRSRAGQPSKPKWRKRVRRAAVVATALTTAAAVAGTHHWAFNRTSTEPLAKSAFVDEGVKQVSPVKISKGWWGPERVRVGNTTIEPRNGYDVIEVTRASDGTLRFVLEKIQPVPHGRAMFLQEEVRVKDGAFVGKGSSNVSLVK